MESHCLILSSRALCPCPSFVGTPLDVLEIVSRRARWKQEDQSWGSFNSPGKIFWWFRPEWWWRRYGTRYILKMWPTEFTEGSMDRVRGQERSRKTPRFMALVRVAIDWHWASVGRTVGKGRIRGSVLDTLYLQGQGGMDLELGVGYSWEKEPRLQWSIWEFVNISTAEKLNEMTERVPLFTTKRCPNPAFWNTPELSSWRW